ncbi:MAG: TIGR02186 family protein [Pseudomonadota bacterium]
MRIALTLQRLPVWSLIPLLFVAVAALASAPLFAETQGSEQSQAKGDSGTATATLVTAATSADPSKGPGATRVEADVSTRSVSITSSFTGVEIVVFGAIDNAQTLAPEAGLYDVVVAVAGEPERTTVRMKERRVGIWLNTQAIKFDNVPSYYAISSTRPINQIASQATLDKNGIGFANIPMTPVTPEGDNNQDVASAEILNTYRSAIVRLKQRNQLFQTSPKGVVFVGRNLFRTTIDLPANVPIGPLEARVFLFRNGELVDTFRRDVSLARSGLERYLHSFAFDRPFLYGIFCVFVAVLAGLLASAIVQRLRRA